MLTGVFPMTQDVLVTSVVEMLIEHPAATLHFNGVAATEVRVQVRAVTAALITSAFEIIILEKQYLERKKIDKFW